MRFLRKTGFLRKTIPCGILKELVGLAQQETVEFSANPEFTKFEPNKAGMSLFGIIYVRSVDNSLVLPVACTVLCMASDTCGTFTDLPLHCLAVHIARLRKLIGQVVGPWLACDEFKSSTPKDPPCRGVMHITSAESSNVLPLVWCVSSERGLPAQVSSSSLDHGSKLRGPSPKTLV
ncbi:hypothetical protein TNCV_2216361 [Trichonephila clavipes]|nr:hypothetical protein TNCV_2216361 [Trichonephila clavipes]